MARIYSGRGNGFSPCTAQSCMEILAHYGVELEGKRVAVLGRSLVVGKPAAMLLAAANATVTIFHSRSGDYTPAVRKGRYCRFRRRQTGAFRRGVFQQGSDRYRHRHKLVGAQEPLHRRRDFDAAEPIVSAITPVPGGVGSVTTAVLRCTSLRRRKITLEKH